MSLRDGHVRVLSLHVANKIAAGEVVERPASVVKELVENALDAGARNIRISIVAGGRKLVSIQDDGCGMTKDDALLSLERQATSKILDVDDIESIDTLGFRGEAIPSIASVSRFTLTTRRAEADEGTMLQVNAGTLAEVRAAGAPPGTLVEVRDLFCNVPARRKFLRAYATEEAHVRDIFTRHALAHPSVGFALVVDGREIKRLAPAASLDERTRELFGADFAAELLPIEPPDGANVRVSGFIERPNLNNPTRRDQYVFVNGRPAGAPSIAAALREAYPRRAGDARPAAILFVDLPPGQVDVNVHPTKREVRFRDNPSVRQAVVEAIARALAPARPTAVERPMPTLTEASVPNPMLSPHVVTTISAPSAAAEPAPATCVPASPVRDLPLPEPLQVEFAVEPDSTDSKPWTWFKYLAQTDSGYLLVETDSGVVTINPHAARERIAYEQLLAAGKEETQTCTQTLLMPESVELSPVEAARISAALPAIRSMGFLIEPFGPTTFKIDGVPPVIGTLPPTRILATIAQDLAESGATRRKGERWREELIARSVARSYAGARLTLTPEGATRLVEELCACTMPYVCPRGKPVMIFTSTRELNRKFGTN